MSDSFRIGSRVHTGFGAYTETRSIGLVIDTPGEMCALVQWQEWQGRWITHGPPDLTNLASLRHAETACSGCGGIRAHKSQCPVAAEIPRTHPFVTAATRPTCRVCDQPERHKLHDLPPIQLT